MPTTTRRGVRYTETGVQELVPHVEVTAFTYGDYPANNTRLIDVTSSATAVLSLATVGGMHRGQFVISGLTLHTIAANAYDSGGNLIGAIIVVANSAPATRVAATALGNGVFSIDVPMSCSTLTFTKSAAAVETVTIRGTLSGAG